MNFTKYFALFLILLFVCSAASAKDLRVDSKSLIRNLQRTEILANQPSVAFELNYSVAREFFTGDYETLEILNFPLVNSEDINLSLSRAYIPFDQNTEFYRGTANGLLPMKAPNVMCLSGKIQGEPHSFVFFTVTDLGFIGTIQKENGLIYTIAPKNQSKTGEHILTNSNSQILDKDLIFECLTDDYAGTSREYEDVFKYKDQTLAPSQLLEVKLACEGTSDFYKIFGNSTSATAYITAVIAQSSKIYEEFLNVRLYIGYVVVWEDDWEDPYYGTKDLSEKLQKMPSVWKGKTIDRALTILFANLANQPANSTVAGISYGGTPYIGSLCSKDWGYNVLGIRGNAIYPTLNYTWDVNVATHEAGHNFSAPHTHNCYWSPNMIDTCVTGSIGVYDACIKTGNPIPRLGTIMSYCHITNSSHSVQLIFHPRELPLMRTAAQKSSCVKPASSPYVSLLNPLGSKIYLAGSQLPIRWTSGNVNYIMIYYSSDNGKTWNLIADNVATNDSIYYWQLPLIRTEKALVLIRDKGNPKVADSSLKPFSIQMREIIIQSPAAQEEYAQGEQILLSWTASLVDTFIVEFSSDGGQTYQTLSSSHTSNQYDFIAPTIQSDLCKFRVKSTDGITVAESPVFRIGAPQGDIIFPDGGEKLCASSSYRIIWDASYVNKVFLEYSTDNGNSWRKISLGGLDAKARQHLWKVPERVSNQCLVRIRPTFKDITIARSNAVFTIDTCQSIGAVEDESFSSLHIKNLLYRADNNSLSFEITSDLDLAGATIKIVDILGRVLYSDAVYPDSIQEERYKIENLYFGQGVYFVVIQKGQLVESVPFVVVR